MMEKAFLWIYWQSCCIEMVDEPQQMTWALPCTICGNWQLMYSLVHHGNCWCFPWRRRTRANSSLCSWQLYLCGWIYVPRHLSALHTADLRVWGTGHMLHYRLVLALFFQFDVCLSARYTKMTSGFALSLNREQHGHRSWFGAWKTILTMTHQNRLI